MFILELVEAILDLFRNAFLNVPADSSLSILYIVLNFFLQIFALFGGGAVCVGL